MASTLDFVEYVCEQVSSCGQVRYKKMFGEYMVYVDDKPVILVCDNTVYIKILPELESVLQNCSKGLPYKGAKEHYILDVDDRELLCEVIKILLPITKLPKKKR